MDLGIAGRKAIVCASSRGLGRACARALAEAGCDVTINGRDGKALEHTAAELHQATGAKVTAVQADVATPEGQAALLSACPEPDILVNNNAGPPVPGLPPAHAGTDAGWGDRQHGGRGRAYPEGH